MPMFIPIGVAAVALSRGVFDAGPPCVADGMFDEWYGRAPVAVDPFGDATGAFDVTAVFAEVRGSELYLAWDTNAPVNLQAGSGADGTIRIELAFSSGGALTVDLRGRTAYWNHNPGLEVSWPSIGYETAPTVAADRYETRLDLSLFLTGPGDVFTVDFSGSDALAGGPLALRANRRAQNPPARSPARWLGTDVRVASLNTLRDGLTDANQRDAVGRLLDSMDAEIICLQEEYNDSAATIKARLEAIDPLGDGAAWNVWKWNDDAVASPYPITPYFGGDGWAAAVVETPAGAVFVASVHPKCCGYVGNSDDDRRVMQMLDLADTIEDLRAGTLQADLIPFAAVPVVVVGDWNLVGSSVPLDVMLDPAGPGLDELVMRRLGSGRTTTWEAPSGFDFSPGRLDLLVYDAPGLTVRNRFVLDTSELGGATLGALGLQAMDSRASDHLMLVADFAFAP
ncbi:MAG: hypothetical protein DHS20C14_04630 [Phycisphaeraceae bacterium]|nr:MAG: hypothetical protein DHS20C14_04630 [Phycisphaeraceae bacterium]